MAKPRYTLHCVRRNQIFWYKDIEMTYWLLPENGEALVQIENILGPDGFQSYYLMRLENIHS